ncbi:MAG: DUF4954 family protein, partial [bacterium]|nr:DUF4954 family protein [bacterium]
DLNTMDSGIYHSTLASCILDGPMLVQDNAFISNYYIGGDSILIHNGSITADKNPVYGNGNPVSVGVETGGREIYSFAELKMEDAVQMAMRKSDKSVLEQYGEFVKEYVKKVVFEKGIICRKVRLFNNSVIKNTFLAEGARIENSLKLDNSTVLCNPAEAARVSDGAFVRNSVLQWGCEVTSMGVVDNSVLTEHSEVERHGKVINSIIGSNTGVAEGEVNSSLVGPFVGFHHQSLLIAALWPEGKGNIGYGANVGSNHTSRAADQEIRIGEGLFFGLGCNIKFPVNFLAAPYSIISTGAVTLPQRVEFPFSLITLADSSIHGHGISPAYNEIIPAWVLSDNMYALKRNESKFKKRNKATRNMYVFEVFRPEIMDLIIKARKALMINEKKEIYTDQDISGLGKNYMLERSRVHAVETYTLFLQYYSLKGLKNQLMRLCGSGGVRVSLEMLQRIKTDKRWEHERSVLQKEFSVSIDLKEMMKKYLVMEETMIERIIMAREKDDKRGRKIMDDYDLVHTPARDDSLVRESYKNLEKIKEEVETIIRALE